MVKYELSQEAIALAKFYGSEEFLDYVINEFIPKVLESQGRYLLRTDYQDMDRNIVNSAWSVYRRRL